MSRRSNHDRLVDVAVACEAIASYLTRSKVGDDIVYDAIRARLIEICEAIKDLDPKLLATEPNIPWDEIARMRDQLTHHYFDTAHSIVHATAANDVPKLAAAVQRLLAAAT